MVYRYYRKLSLQFHPLPTFSILYSENGVKSNEFYALDTARIRSLLKDHELALDFVGIFNYEKGCLVQQHSSSKVAVDINFNDSADLSDDELDGIDETSNTSLTKTSPSLTETDTSKTDTNLSSGFVLHFIKYFTLNNLTPHDLL